MAQIGLIDVDGHNYPNLVLMKLSAWHKQMGDTVEWWREDGWYDLVYMAKVFSNDYSPDIPEPTNAAFIIKGGTGYAIDLVAGIEVYFKEKDPVLPQDIEHMYPDYSLYPDLCADTAYGFLTRGCPRGCGFCHVAPKEGKCSYKVADLSEFWSGQKHIVLNDPNLLACPDALDLLQQLADSGATVELNQGIDARLITPGKAALMAKMKLKHAHFAMDTMASVEPASKGLRYYREAVEATGKKWDWRTNMVFCLVNFDTTPFDDFKRVYTLRKLGYLPYIMIYDKPHAKKNSRYENTEVVQLDTICVQL